MRGISLWTQKKITNLQAEHDDDTISKLCMPVQESV